MLEVIVECPLGGKCEYIGDDKKLHRCAWYTHLIGKNPQSEQQVDEWKCAMAWMPLMMVENAQTIRGVQAATESFRNEMVLGQQLFSEKVTALEKIQDRKLLDG
jgi:hypothetical protein